MNDMTDRHIKGSLEQLQSLDLESKIMMTQARIKAWYEHYDGNVYVSFSGGKDSTVLLHIVRSIYPSVDGVFCDTGLEFPEIREFVRTFENITWLKPSMNFKEVVNHYGYPMISKEVSQYIFEARTTKSEKVLNLRLHGRNNTNNGKIPEKWKFLVNAPFQCSHMCCKIMKKNPSKKYEKQTGKKPFIGTLACESTLRKQAWIKHGCNAFNLSRPVSTPLSFWTEQDILKYIVDNHIKIASVYGEIVNKNGIYVTTKEPRTGCMFCGFGCHIENPNRFERIKITHPKIYEFIMKPTENGGLGMKNVLDYINQNLTNQIGDGMNNIRKFW